MANCGTDPTIKSRLSDDLMPFLDCKKINISVWNFEYAQSIELVTSFT